MIGHHGFGFAQKYLPIKSIGIIVIFRLVIGPAVSSTHGSGTSYPDPAWWWSRSYDSVWNEDATRWSCVHPSALIWCLSLSVRTQSTEPVEARHGRCISQSHVCPWPWATCHFLFLYSHWSLLLAVAYLYEGWCHWAHVLAVVEGLLVFIWFCHCWSVNADNCRKVVLAQRLTHSVTYWPWHLFQLCDDILFESKAHSGLPSFSFGFATPEERVFQVIETTRLWEPCFTLGGDVGVVFGKFHCY